MIVDLETVLGESLAKRLGGPGTGGTAQGPGGEWYAWAVLDGEDRGVYAMAYKEQVALKCLELKLQSMWRLAQAGYEEAATPHRMKEAADIKEYADKLRDLMGLADEKKPAGEN